MNKICIDASVFLGMNAEDEQFRISCKNFIIENRRAEIFMNFEQVGFCDHIIWSFSFEQQSIYYPFMDLFHSTFLLKRLPYSPKTFAKIPQIHNISLTDKFNIAFSEEHQAKLYTLKPGILTTGFGKKIPVSKSENPFDDRLEEYYQDSLGLRINMESIMNYAE